MQLIISFCFVTLFTLGQAVFLANGITDEHNYVSVGLNPTIATLIQTLTTHAINAFNLSSNVSIQFKYDNHWISELLGHNNSEATTCHDLGIETDRATIRFFAQNKKPNEIMIDGRWVYAPPHNDISLYSYSNLRISFDLSVLYRHYPSDEMFLRGMNYCLWTRFAEVLWIQSDTTDITIVTSHNALSVSLITNVTGQPISTTFSWDVSGDYPFENSKLKTGKAWNTVSIEFQNNSKMILTINGIQNVFKFDLRIFNPINHCHRMYVGFRHSGMVELAKYRSDYEYWQAPAFWDEDNGGIQPIKLRNLKIDSLATSDDMVNYIDTLKLARKYALKQKLKQCTIL